MIVSFLGPSEDEGDGHATSVATADSIKEKSLKEKQFKSATFSNLTLTLFWENQKSDTAHLLEEGYCIYTRHLDADALIQVLVTGCEEADSFSIQVHSGVTGDRLYWINQSRPN